MKKLGYHLLKGNFFILFCLGMGFCLASVQAQVTPARPRKAPATRMGDRPTTSPKAALVLTDKDLRAFELKRMAQDKQRFQEWAKRLAATTGEDLDSWQYAEEYQRFMEDLRNTKSQVLWDELPSVDISEPPAPSLKAQNALKEINEKDRKLQEEAAAEALRKEKEKKLKEAAEKDMQIKKQQEKEMKKQEQEAAQQKSATQEQ